MDRFYKITTVLFMTVMAVLNFVVFDTYLDEFREYEGENFTYHNVFQRMVKSGYRFSSMTSKQVQLCLIEHKMERGEV